MTGFELRTSVVGSYNFTNCARTTAYLLKCFGAIYNPQFAI